MTRSWQHLNSFFQGIQLTWLNVVVARTAGQDLIFYKISAIHSPLGGRNKPPKARVHWLLPELAAAKKAQTPDLKMLISWSWYWFPSSCHSWKHEGVPQPGEASVEQLQSLQSAEALDSAAQTARQQETWVSVKAQQSWNTSRTALHFMWFGFACANEAS